MLFREHTRSDGFRQFDWSPRREQFLVLELATRLEEYAANALPSSGYHESRRFTA